MHIPPNLAVVSMLWVELLVAQKNWAQRGAMSSQLLVFLLMTCDIELVVSLTGF